MNRNLLSATVLGGLVLFVWGAISHMVLPFYNSTLLKFTNEEAVVQAILANTPTSGVYFLPNMRSHEGMTSEQIEAANKVAEERMMNGPFMLASIRLGPMGWFPGYFIVELVTDMLVALFVSLVLMNVKEMSFRNRVMLVVWFSLVVFFASSAPYWNWYAFSTAFTLAELFDMVVGFCLAGLVIARYIPGKMMREKPAA